LHPTAVRERPSEVHLVVVEVLAELPPPWHRDYRTADAYRIEDRVGPVAHDNSRRSHETVHLA
jgi:hypothetical protein